MPKFAVFNVIMIDRQRDTDGQRDKQTFRMASRKVDRETDKQRQLKRRVARQTEGYRERKLSTERGKKDRHKG